MKNVFRKISNVFISGVLAMAGILPFWSVPVLADSASNEQALTWVFNNPLVNSRYSSSSYPFIHYRIGTVTNFNDVGGLVTPSSSVTSPNTFYAFAVRLTNSDGSAGNWITCVFAYASSQPSGKIYTDYSVDSGLSWTNISFSNLTSSYTYSGVDLDTGNSVSGDKIYYAYLIQNSSSNAYSWIERNMPDDMPRIILNSGQDVKTVLALFSKHDFSVLPWNMSTSSGGMHFADGTELDSTNTNKYSQIFVVMDNNHDNVVSEAEVYYYNATYNTSYDYSTINNDTDFSSLEFLYWVATQINDGVDNPGGGSGDGSGGGSSVIGGGISVTDSFTQSQTQTIEENAVNVTVNNNNALTQENYQELNSLINNYNGSSEDETDPFQQAIGNFQAFHAIALAFAGLASVVFGWLPWWVTALLGAMFSMVCVFIVLRLIHLFK